MTATSKLRRECMIFYKKTRASESFERKFFSWPQVWLQRNK